RAFHVTGVQTCALPISGGAGGGGPQGRSGGVRADRRALEPLPQAVRAPRPGGGGVDRSGVVGRLRARLPGTPPLPGRAQARSVEIGRASWRETVEATEV